MSGAALQNREAISGFLSRDFDSKKRRASRRRECREQLSRVFLVMKHREAVDEDKHIAKRSVSSVSSKVSRVYRQFEIHPSTHLRPAEGDHFLNVKRRHREYLWAAVHLRRSDGNLGATLSTRFFRESVSTSLYNFFFSFT